MRCIEKVLDPLKVFKHIKMKVLICSDQFWKYNVYQHEGTTLVYLIVWESAYISQIKGYRVWYIPLFRALFFLPHTNSAIETNGLLSLKVLNVSIEPYHQLMYWINMDLQNQSVLVKFMFLTIMSKMQTNSNIQNYVFQNYIITHVSVKQFSNGSVLWI